MFRVTIKMFSLKISYNILVASFNKNPILSSQDVSILHHLADDANGAEFPEMEQKFQEIRHVLRRGGVIRSLLQTHKDT